MQYAGGKYELHVGGTRHKCSRRVLEMIVIFFSRISRCTEAQIPLGWWVRKTRYLLQPH